MHSSRSDGQGSERARVAFGISSYISLGNRFFDFRAGSALTMNLRGKAGKVVLFEDLSNKLKLKLSQCFR